MEKLLNFLKKDKPVSIIVHNNPDPDSLASAIGLQYILKKMGHKRVRIYYDGLIGRAENQAMIKILNIPLCKTKNIVSPKGRQYILVDCQPDTGNVTLPGHVKPFAAIDHHSLSKNTKKLTFFDVRPWFGSCSTLIHEYFASLQLPIPKNIATALFYAIFSETQGLGREGSQADKEAYLKLLPQMNFEHLSRIQYPAVSKDFVTYLSRVLTNSFYYKNLTGAVLDRLPYPDFVAEMADFLLRIKNITWSICLGSYKNIIYISVRTTNIDADASKTIKKVIPKHGSAGGHDMIAGAQVKVDGRKKKLSLSIKKDIVKKMLQELNHQKVQNVFKLVTNEEFSLDEI
jgi:nanoRNase/pAp phosphatase (c-di-AMP/oligoRNAs hydrolase)